MAGKLDAVRGLMLAVSRVEQMGGWSVESKVALMVLKLVVWMAAG
jgi:hypothetical protein